MQPEHAIIGEVTRYLEAAVADRGVDVRLGVSATPELLRELSPDVIVIATGSEPNLPNLRATEPGTRASSVGRCSRTSRVSIRILSCRPIRSFPARWN